ncbi:MAG: hypothetical protein ACOY90_22830 [Candidatus Zhuqueibacterota bacterium]
MKKKFDKNSIRGIIYSLISLAGLSYELFFSVQVRAFLIVMYSFTLAIGLLYLLFLKEQH